MRMYEYRCLTCGVRFSSPQYGLEEERHECFANVQGTVVRVYSFSFHRPMQPHYNPSAGAPLSNKRDIATALRREEERQFLQTGVEHSYASADLRDRDIFPVTTDGLDTTYDAHDASSPVRRAIESVESV